MYLRGLDGMLTKQSEMSETQQQLSSGKRILTPSDDPAGSALVLGFNREINNINQYGDNIALLTNRLEQEESALAGVGNILQRVGELTVQGSNDTYSAQDRSALAIEVRSLLDDLLGLANSTDSSGEYLFSGYQGKVEPFSLTASGYAFHGDMGQRHIRISDGRTLADSDSGFDVFMDIPTSSGGVRNVFDTLEQIAQALEADNSPSAYLDDLQLIEDNINEVRAGIGVRLNSIGEQTEINENAKLTLRTQRSRVEDLDYTEAISRFNQQQVALEAAQRVYVNLQGLSLFNFLR